MVAIMSLSNTDDVWWKNLINGAMAFLCLILREALRD